MTQRGKKNEKVGLFNEHLYIFRKQLTRGGHLKCNISSEVIDFPLCKLAERNNILVVLTAYEQLSVRLYHLENRR